MIDRMVRTIFIFILFQTIFLGCSKSGVIIMLQNDSQKNLDEISIEFTGGVEIISNLKPNEKRELLIQPSGESSIILKTNFGSKEIKKDLDLYFEPNYSGSVNIVFKINGEIVCTPKIGI